MKSSTVFVSAAAILLVCAASSAPAQQHCPNPSGQWTQIDRTRHPFDQNGVPQDKLAPHTRADVSDDQIYGHEIMSARELKKFRKALRKIGADDEKLEAFLAQHRQQMQQRAQELGVDLEEVQS
jgi:hypothetical protein